MSSFRTSQPSTSLRSCTVAAASALALLSATACGSDPQAPQLRVEVDYQPASLSSATAAEDVVAAGTRFGAQTLEALAAGENLVVSPASLTTALAMLAEAAEGPAAAELEELLGAAGESRAQAFSALQAAVGEYDGDPAAVQEDDLPERPLVHLANQLVIQDGVEPDDDLLETLASAYDAGLVTTDFAQQESKDLLDVWVDEHTGGLIEKSGVHAPDDRIRFVLQNAVVLAAQWQSPFSESATAEGDFITGTGASVRTDLMQQRLFASYTEYDGAQAVRLPYTEGFAMDVVLPAEGQDPAAITGEDWLEISAALGEESAGAEVDLMLPRVEISSSEDLIDLLLELGLEATVAGDDLSKLTPGTRLSQVAHQTVMRVDEEGTVAAGVTEIVGLTSGTLEEPVQLHVDRPYTLRIVHTETDWPLFMGVVYDPTAE